jgi:hypothetical protein
VKNILLFVGVIIGTVLLVAGFVAFDRGEPGGWLYVVGAVAAFALASAPGRRLMDSVLTQRPRA